MPPSEKQARVLWTTITTLAVVILVGLAGLLLWGLGWITHRLSSVLLPLAIAAILAFILDPVVDFFEKRVQSRLKSIWMVFLLAFLLVVGLSATIIPRLVIEVQSFFSQVPGYVLKVRDKTNTLLAQPPSWIPAPILRRIPLFQDRIASPTNHAALTNLVIVPSPGQETNSAASTVPSPASSHSVQGTNNPTPPTPTVGSPVPPGRKPATDLNKELFTWAANALPAIGTWALDQVGKVASVAGFLAGLALVPVYLFYLLLEKRKIQRRWTDFLPVWESQAKEELIFILSSINDCLVVFFRGQVLVALCVGTLLTIGFSLMGLDYALLLGAMAGILGIVPYLGVAISLVPALIIAIVQFGDWWHPLAVLAIFGAVQALEGLVISPRIIGDRVGLHPLTVILAVMVGTTLFGGILGGVLAIPATATLRALMFRYVWKNHLAPETKQGLPRPAPTPEIFPTKP